jgi:hypothetical protein
MEYTQIYHKKLKLNTPYRCSMVPFVVERNENKCKGAALGNYVICGKMDRP